MYLKGIAAALVLGLTAVGANAAVVVLDFGSQPGNYSPYQEDGYNVAANSNGTGSVQLDNSGGQCPFSDPACMHVSGSNPGTAYVARQDGSMFDAFSLAINFSGKGNTNYVEFDNGPQDILLALGSSYASGVFTSAAMTTLVTGMITKNTDYFIDLAGLAVANGQGAGFFTGIYELSIKSAGGGANVRVDNISVSAVPLPAGIVLLLGGLGALGALRRKRKAA